MTMENPLNKERFREELKKARAELSYERRQDASRELFRNLIHFLSDYETVLSFVNFGHEIDTSLLNLFLSRTSRLLLPKVHDQGLKIYRVTDLDRQLAQNSSGILEPHNCEEISKEEVRIMLVPGLGFDRQNHRIGYGKGYYDRLISEIPNCPTIGVGFKEQFVDALPKENFDRPLLNVSLF